ncbi:MULTISPECIES: hypothetical protein [unclassified Sphingomonas]|jgi:hypothetical protein|nr:MULTISPECIES: hypothetical protein [unclassified Sphingomonas]MBA4763005.1 hypothetical protein [Sphingomonas sp.]
MERILSALLILVLAFSHGPMSAAVPHLDGSTHEHVRMVDADHHDDHGSDDSQFANTDDASAKPDDFGKATHGLGHHTHVATDGVPSSGVSLAARSIDRDRLLPGDDARLRSALLEPLPEPPSA